jgi:DNA-binding response OmpR family regulator
MNRRVDVALILWNPDVIELVSFALLQRHMKSSGIEPSAGVERMENFLRSTTPSVVILDLEPPYERSAELARRLLDRFRDCSFVITCADSALACSRVSWLARYPVFQKPYEILEIARFVRSIVRRSRVPVGALSVGTS